MARREDKRRCTEEPCIEDLRCPWRIKSIRNSEDVQVSNNKNYGADYGQDTLVASTLASFLITQKDTFFDRAAFSLMCCCMGDAMDHVDLPVPAIMKPVELWTGKQLFSVIVCINAHTKEFVNLIVKEKIYTKYETMCPSDGYVYFRNGELISGQLGKATLGNGNKDGLFSVLLRDYNSHAAGRCMNGLAKLSAWWLWNYGFSIGIDDVHQLPAEQPSIRPRDFVRRVVPNFALERCN